MGEVKFKNLFVDGTKIEAYANKYTFVWKKAVEKNLAKLEKKISLLLLAFALNIEKLCNRTKKGRIGLDLFALNAS